ncbi:jg19317, partial [Pararge aegeria aegeria]
DESSVAALMEACITDDDKLYLCVSSPTIRDKPVQIRPWRLADADFVLDASMPLDPRKTVFVGGVPRPLKAVELAMIMDRLYGGVCYAGIDTDPELKYPKDCFNRYREDLFWCGFVDRQVECRRTSRPLDGYLDR